MSELWVLIGYYLIAVIATEAITEILVASELPPLLALKALIGKVAYQQYDVQLWRRLLWPATVLALFLNKLLSCGWCCSVWVAILAAITLDAYGLVVWAKSQPLLVLVNAAFIHRLANLYHAGFELLRRGRARAIDLALPEAFTVTLKIEERNRSSEADQPTTPPDAIESEDFDASTN